jgi:hypothetical protein
MVITIKAGSSWLGQGLASQKLWYTKPRSLTQSMPKTAPIICFNLANITIKARSSWLLPLRLGALG